jgi:regulator of replication initiation timing
MTSLEIVAGLSIAVIVALVYFLGEAYAELDRIKNQYNDKIDLLTNAALELEHLKRKLEKINELTRP